MQTPPAPGRTVRCYHCGRPCEVSAHALSSSCPHCHKQLAVADIVVRARHWGTRLQTCGRIVLEPAADVRVGLLTAGAGVEVHGVLRGRVVSYGPVKLGHRARVEGDLTAPAVDVEPGATILGGSFSIRPNPS
jgi:hypothetical protein